MRVVVTYRLVYESDKEIRYEYFPDGDEDYAAGLIGIDVQKKEISVLQKAELDVLLSVSAEHMKAIRDSINEMRAERSAPPLTEKELPEVTEESSYYCYASHAMKEIETYYCRGEVIKKGEVMWY